VISVKEIYLVLTFHSPAVNSTRNTESGGCQMLTWVNFLVKSKFAKNTEGIVDSSKLLSTIKQHDGSEAYMCAFDCSSEELLLEDGKKTFKGYTGVVRPALGLVSLDFDSEKLEESARDVKNFINFTGIKNYFVAFSGSKGFHLSIPLNSFGFDVSANLPKQLRGVAHELKKSYPTLDTSVFNANRKFRVLNSKHPKTGLYKTLVTLSQLDNIATLKNYCKHRSKTIYGVLPVAEPNKILVSLGAVVPIHSESRTTDLTLLERFDGKLCIRKILNSMCEVGERNNTALVLINDFKKAGIFRADAVEKIHKWALQNGLPLHEVDTQVDNIYSEVSFYNHGCQEPIKAKHCTAKCSLYYKLDPTKRPQAIDASKKSNSERKNIAQIEVVGKILKHFDGKLIKQNHDLFYYTGTHWRLLDDAWTDKLKTRINAAYENKATFSKVDATFKMLLLYVPAVPDGVNMFTPNPVCANFKNGTLHLLEDGEGNYTLEFKQHNKLDYVTNIVDIDYGTEETNPEFLAMLDRIFEGEDCEGKLRALAQMFGAALMPAFPHLFFLHGVVKSGKSTLCLILEKLLKQENMCGVQPHEFNGFNMASMAGKLVNMVTDVNHHKQINDDVVKQIEDRKVIRIQRKGKDDLYSPLPAIHVFGANQLPKTLENQNAHERRWTFLQFNNTVKGAYHRNFASIVFRKNPEGVLNFAMQGLKDLVESGGIFFNPETSKETQADWQVDSDYVQQFLDDMKDGEAAARFEDEAKIKRADFWGIFNDWMKANVKQNHDMRKKDFFDALKTKGHTAYKSEGIYKYKGFQACSLG